MGAANNPKSIRWSGYIMRVSWHQNRKWVVFFYFAVRLPQSVVSLTERIYMYICKWLTLVGLSVTCDCCVYMDVRCYCDKYMFLFCRFLELGNYLRQQIYIYIYIVFKRVSRFPLGFDCGDDYSSFDDDTL